MAPPPLADSPVELFESPESLPCGAGFFLFNCFLKTHFYRSFIRRFNRTVVATGDRDFVVIPLMERGHVSLKSCAHFLNSVNFCWFLNAFLLGMFC